MADTQINTGNPLRLEAGGIFRITPAGGSDYDVRKLEPGSVEIEEGGYEQLHYTDRGINQTPLEGDEKLTTIKARFKLTTFAANELRALSVARDTSTGLLKQHTVVIQWLDNKGSATGKRLTYAGCNFTGPAKIKTGKDFDIAEIELTSTTAIGVASTF